MSAANNHIHLKNKGENPYRFPAPTQKFLNQKLGHLKSPSKEEKWWYQDGDIKMVIPKWWYQNGDNKMVIPKWWYQNGDTKTSKCL